MNTLFFHLRNAARSLGLLALAALAARLFPALRAARMQPSLALRSE